MLPSASGHGWCCDDAIPYGTGVSEAELVASIAFLALAAFAQGVFGLGFAMIATPLLALILDYQAAVFLAAVPLLVLASFWLVTNRRLVRQGDIPWTLLPGIALGAAVGVAIQVALAQSVSLLLLAALLVFSVMLPWALRRLINRHAAVGARSAPLFGFLAGLTESALNVGAPFIILYAGLRQLSRAQMLIALNLCFALGKTIQIFLSLSIAPVPVGWMPLILGVPVCLFAFRLGDRLAGRFPEEVFRIALRLFLCALAAMLVIRSLLMSNV